MKEKKIVNMMEYLPQLSLRERDRRWTAVREGMALHSIAWTAFSYGTADRFFGYSSANLRYLTQITGEEKWKDCSSQDRCHDRVV